MKAVMQNGIIVYAKLCRFALNPSVVLKLLTPLKTKR
jgi:hypothetical protein